VTDYFEVGKIVNTYGIKGFVKVVGYTDEITRFEELEKVYIDNNNKLDELIIEEVKYSKNNVLLKFENIKDINEAEKLRNLVLKIPRSMAKKLEEDTYFIADLIGLEVYSVDKQYLGKVEDIYNLKSNDVYVIKNAEGKQTLIPALKEYVIKIDLENSVIIVKVPKVLE
jgi:16S rRNA processing protein RimM